jgi:23S rRNA (uracil1939-C5)-methyltransferase
MLKPGDEVALSIEKPAAGGRMIARVDGQVVLVSGAVPGERVTARVERVGRGVAYADATAIDDPSPDRRPTDQDPLCGGCAYAHVTYARQLTIKALVIEDALARIGRLSLPAPLDVMPSPEAAYRMRARLHVRGGHVGFFREGTHDVCDARQTRQLRDDTCDAVERLTAGLRSLGWTARHELDVSENIDASQRVVHIESPMPVGMKALAGLGATDGLTGLTVSMPYGQRTRAAVVAGDPHVVDVLDLEGTAVRLRRHVLSFFQGNRFLLPSLVAHVVEQVPQGERVVDLYAGAGLFSVAAAAVRRAHVTAVEGDPSGAADLAANAEQVEGQLMAVHEPVEHFLGKGQAAPSVVVVDPPRTGMSKEALQGAIDLNAPTVVYVSCDVATFARDARKLVDAGYRLAQVRGFDLFPNTPHVETVATFQR